MTALHVSAASTGAPTLPAFLTPRVERYYHERVHETWADGNIMRGAEPDADALMLKTNDYLGLGHHPEIAEAQVQAILDSGSGLMMSSVFLNGPSPQRQFESALARHMRSETSIVSQSGYMANVGLIQTIADKSTPVYIDMIAHASLWAGIHAADAMARPFRHNDIDHLRRQLEKYGPGVVIIDSVYSTNGSIAPIGDVVGLAEEFGCAIVVDESHSLGTHGPGGAGLVVELGLEERVHFRTASLAKAFCGRAGVVTCSERFAEYMTFEAFPIIFSSTVLPHEFAAFSKTLEIVRRDEWRRHRLHSNAAWLRDSLDGLGYNVDASQSQIISLESGTEQQTIVLRDALESRGIFGAPFCAPATPKNRACIRLSIHAELDMDDLDRIAGVCAEIRDEVGLQDWPSTRRKARCRHSAPLRLAA
jgi:CAI-1 autoinducer synthase